MHQTPTLIAEFPAVRVMETPDWKRKKMKHGDVFVVMRPTRNHGDLPQEYRLGSIFGFAVEYGDDPLEAYERNREHGHISHWANPLPTMLDNGPKKQKQRFALNIGDIIGFEGKWFRLDDAPNRNITLTPVTG